jgi:hypothetical protein
MFDFENTCGEADRPLRRLIGMSFRPGIPWQVALQQSLPPLSQPEPSCHDKGSSVERFSADGACLTSRVSQKGPQSTQESALFVFIRVYSWPKAFAFSRGYRNFATIASVNSPVDAFPPTSPVRCFASA